MVTVCTGWLKPHATIIMKAEDGGVPGTSHGMCEACYADQDRELLKAEAYAEYLRNFPRCPDPRD